MKDDAAHKPRIFGNVETWYYDAMFDNNYSMVCLVNAIQFLKTGLVLTGLFIYKDTKLIKNIRNRASLQHFHASKERPRILVRNTEIINGEINKDSENWEYHISMGDEKNNVSLNFTQKMEPWKGNHFLGSWLVVPKLNINGNICIDGKKIDVTGHGYHDHNNYPIFSPFFSKGANFGKIVAGPINVVWAQVIRNKDKIENISVINKDDKFQSIPSKDIRLFVEDHVKEHGKIVPTRYSLNVEKKDINIDVKIESMNYHYVTIPSVKYWRHHAKNTGEISCGSTSTRINNISIIDQLSFL